MYMEKKENTLVNSLKLSIAVIAVAKGKYASSKTNDYGLKDGIYTDAEGNKITNVMAVT